MIQKTPPGSQDGQGPVRALSAQDALPPSLEEVRAVLEPFARAFGWRLAISDTHLDYDRQDIRDTDMAASISLGDLRKAAALYARLPLLKEKSAGRQTHGERPCADPQAVQHGFEALAAEFAKPQFMTTTSGPGSRPGTRRYSLEFTFVDEGDSTEGHARRDALHEAIRIAAKAAQSSEAPRLGSSEAEDGLVRDRSELQPPAEKEGR